MLSETLITIFERDLNKLKEELNAYSDESKLWSVEKGISNSAGNLCLHLIGNLNHFIGATLGHTGYVRDRDSEFTLKNVPRSEMLGNIDKTIIVIREALGPLSDKDFEKTYDAKVWKDQKATGFFMMHLATHLSYHLGQINYHRRLIAS